MGKLFGTDGIRGIANKDLNCELAIKTAVACTSVLMRRDNKKVRVIIGQDTRASGDMLASAMAAGFCSAGADVTLIGILPTPAVAYLVREMNADAGIMISASHNPAAYNGIKIFSSNGYKLLDEIEEEIELMIFNNVTPSPLVAPGHISTDERAVEKYIEYIISCADTDISGMRVSFDCANGAASTTARRIFEGLGVCSYVFHAEPNGFNINQNCGSTFLEEAAKQVGAGACEIGFSFDGDTDRCLAVDPDGNQIDGDKIVGTLALYNKSIGTLAKDTVIVTIMSNIGFIEMLKLKGIDARQVKVGDRYVLEEMVKGGFNLGGENSGHVILHDKNTTGDGQLTAVMILCAMKRLGLSANDIFNLFKPYPQIQLDVVANKEQKDFLEQDEIFQHAVKRVTDQFIGKGRVLVRASGTEPKLRIMVEGKDRDAVENLAHELVLLANKRIAAADVFYDLEI